MITDLNIWNIPLSPNDIENFALKCNQSLLEQRKVIKWEKLNNFKKGNLTRVVDIKATDDACSTDPGKEKKCN